MSKITSLGRVVGSKWYTGTSFDVAFKPLDKDMFFKTDTLEFFQYIEKYKSWSKVGVITFDNYVVAENVKTSEDVTKSINGVPFKDIFEFVDYGNGKVFTPKVKRAKEAEKCSTSIYSEYANKDENGNRIIDTYATKKDVNNLIGIDHSSFVTREQLENEDINVKKSLYSEESNYAKNITTKTLIEAIGPTDKPMPYTGRPISFFIELNESKIPTGKMKKSIEADNVVSTIKGIPIDDILSYDDADQLTPIVWEAKFAGEAQYATNCENAEKVKGSVLHHVDVEDLVGDSIKEITISKNGLYSCSIYRRGLPDYKFTALISIFKDANGMQYFDFEQTLDGDNHLTPAGWLVFNSITEKLSIERSAVAETKGWSYSFYDIRLLMEY